MKKKRRFADLSIRNKVQYIFVIFMAITVVLCTVFYYSITTITLRNTYREKNKVKLNTVLKNYDSVISNVNNISKLIMVNDTVVDYLKAGAPDNSKHDTSSDNVRRELYKILNSFSGNHYVFVMKQCEVSELTQYRADSKPEDPGRKVLKTFSVNAAIGVMTPVEELLYYGKDYEKAIRKKGGYVVVPDGNPAIDSNTYSRVISFRRIVNDIYTQKKIGFLVINIPVIQLSETFENYIGDDGVVAYVNKKGEVIDGGDNISEYKKIQNNQNVDSAGGNGAGQTESEQSSVDQKQKQIDEILKENPHILYDETDEVNGESAAGDKAPAKPYHKIKNHMVIDSHKIDDTDIYLICVTEIPKMGKPFVENLGLVLGMIAALIIILLLISKYINRYVTIPVSRLSETMRTSDNEAPVLLQDIYTSDDEIGTLHKRYNEMTLKINRLLERVVEQEKQRRKAEMMVVQEQMKPHFLYNTLDTIGCMALQNTREEVYDAIETLGTFYRKFLSKGSETIPISDEISIVKSYIKLLRLRYDDMFEDYYEIQDNLNSVMIIKLILQPLVENSIYHGIRPKGEHGIIKISIYTEGTRMHIKVYDSGIGMSRERIDMLLKGEDKRSFGFKGTIERIKSFYQNDVFVNISSTEGEFCEIDINIPCRQGITEG